MKFCTQGTSFPGRVLWPLKAPSTMGPVAFFASFVATSPGYLAEHVLLLATIVVCALRFMSMYDVYVISISIIDLATHFFIAIFPVCQMNNFTFGAQWAQAALLEGVDDFDDLSTVCYIGESPMVRCTWERRAAQEAPRRGTLCAGWSRIACTWQGGKLIKLRTEGR